MKKYKKLSFVSSNILLITACLFLVACGGSSSDSNTLQDDSNNIDISSMITTPENDIDGNGVQDIVDARITERYTNPTEYLQAIHTAKSMQGIVTAHQLNNGKIEQAVKDFVISANCHEQIFGENSPDALHAIEADAFASFEQYLIYIEMTEEYFEYFNDSTGLTESDCLGLIGAQ